MPATAVAMARVKVVVARLWWAGSMAVLNVEDADWQQSRRRKLMTPSASCKEYLTGCLAAVWLTHLYCSQAHGHQTKPGVNAVQMRTSGLVLPHPDRQEAQHHAGDAQQVEQDVHELAADLETTAA